MHALLWFWLGTMVGGFIGVFTMCLLQASRCSINEVDWYEEEKY